MEQFILEEFRCVVEEALQYNGNYLDLITKLHMSHAKMSRAAAKAITQCGCVVFDGAASKYGKTTKERAGFRGQMCDICREELEKAAGEHLFYLSGFLSAVGIDLYDIYLKELNRQKLLGKYSLR